MQRPSRQGWREQVAEEHRLLHRRMAGLRRTLRQPDPEPGEASTQTWAADLSRQLVDFHDLLRRHFRYEEQGGMMTDLMESHPRSTGQVNELIEEHVTVLDENRTLIGRLLAFPEDEPSAAAEVKHRLAAMLDALGEHERKENALVIDMAFGDLGSGD